MTTHTILFASALCAGAALLPLQAVAVDSPASSSPSTTTTTQTTASMNTTTAQNSDMTAAARDAISRQLNRASRPAGLLELSALTLSDSATRDGVSTITYTGEARLTQDAAVWLDNGGIGGNNVLLDLRHFVSVPAPDYLKDKTEKKRVCQLWKKGDTFAFTGSAIIRKFDEGWRAVYDGSDNSIGDGPDLDAQVTGDPRPKQFALFHPAADGTIKEVRSDKAGIIIPAPTDAQIRAAFADVLKTYGADVVKPATDHIEILKRDMEPQDGGHDGTSSFDADLKVTFTPALPIVSYKGALLNPAPKAGDTVRSWWLEPDYYQRETMLAKRVPYWPADEKLTFTVRVELTKDKAGDTWESPRIIGGYHLPKSPRTMLIRYTYDDAAKTSTVTEATIEEKQ